LLVGGGAAGSCADASMQAARTNSAKCKGRLIGESLSYTEYLRFDAADEAGVADSVKASRHGDRGIRKSDLP